MMNTSGTKYGVKALIIIVITTTLGFIPIFFLGLLKLLPLRHLKSFCTIAVDKIATLWSDINNACINRNPVQWEITGLENLTRQKCYLVIANHQSWLDIVILQRLFNRKIPVLKFFIKDQLKWVPLLGFCWWAMGCPFMKRYSKEYLAEKPHKKNKDLQSAQKAIALFKYAPVTIMNFVEGTRFSHEKYQQQKSPYQHLLKPRSGGISFAISTMGQQFDALLDVTIVYPDPNYSLWAFLCHRMNTIKVHVRQLEIPSHFINSSLLSEEKILEEFRNWLNAHWLEKDRLIASLKA